MAIINAGKIVFYRKEHDSEVSAFTQTCKCNTENQLNEKLDYNYLGKVADVRKVGLVVEEM